MNWRWEGEGMERGIWSDGGMKHKRKAEVHEAFERNAPNRKQSVGRREHVAEKRKGGGKEYGNEVNNDGTDTTCNISLGTCSSSGLKFQKSL
jgi:hypothetical protein